MLFVCILSINLHRANWIQLWSKVNIILLWTVLPYQFEIRYSVRLFPASKLQSHGVHPSPHSSMRSDSNFVVPFRGWKELSPTAFTDKEMDAGGNGSFEILFRFLPYKDPAAAYKLKHEHDRGEGHSPMVRCTSFAAYVVTIYSYDISNQHTQT